MNILIDQAYAWLLLAILIGIAAQWRRPAARSGALVVTTLAVGSLMVMSLPAVGFLALGTLEWRYPPRSARPDGIEAIVVLGGSVLPADELRATPEMGRSSHARCRFALNVYRSGPPTTIVLCGGSPDGGAALPAIAPLMRDYLVQNGVPASRIVVEDRSRTTDENASEGAAILRSRAIGRAVLITDALHMDRAMGVFRKQGVSATPWACNHRATSISFRSVVEQLPNPRTAGVCVEVLHEWAGSIWYAARGKMSWGQVFGVAG